jgi:hypothetical protein
MIVPGPAPFVSVAEALEAGLSLAAIVDDPALAGAVPAPLRAAWKKALVDGTPLGTALSRAGLLDEADAALLDAGARGGFLPRALRSLAAELKGCAQ